MKRFYLIVSLVLSLLLFNTCTKKVVDLTCSVHGSITDKLTNEAISGARVVLSPSNKSITTGSDGLYEFINLDANTYTIQASASGYSTESVEITLKAMDETKRDIHLTPALPKLSVSVDKLNFDVNTSTLSFSITNTGQNSLDWSISDKADWLTFKPSSGNTTTTPTAVTVEVSRNGLTGGTYSETLAITSNGGDKTIPVTLEVAKVNTQLKITPEQLAFGTTESVLDLTLENVGTTAAIDYTASTSNNWIKLSNTSGTVTTKGTVKVSVDRGSLDAGKHEGSVTIKVADQPTVIPVSMEKLSESIPIVNISEPGDITFNSIELKGSIIDIGSSKVTSHGFCWNTTGNPSIENSPKCNLGDCSSSKQFNYIATSLETNTKYYVKAYAENAVGVAYSSVKEISTQQMPSSPIVETQEVGSITTTTAKAVGSITSLGNVSVITEYGHIWSVNENDLTIALSTKTTLGETENTGSFTSDIKNLSSHTTYYYRSYATNSEGTGYGEVKSFTTKATTPSVSTEEATSISTNTATLNGIISDDGGADISAYGFKWGLSAGLLSEEVKKTNNITGSFSEVLTNLSKNVTYYYQAFASNANGTVYGEVKSFTTNSSNAVVITNSASAITINSATLNGTISDNGGNDITSYGFLYGLSSANLDQNIQQNTSVSGAFALNISNLSPATTYYYKAFAVNETGTSYGEVQSFSTNTTIPTIETNEASSITTSSAVIAGQIKNDGGETIIEYGFNWGLSSNSLSENISKTDNKTGVFTESLSDLSKNTDFYFQAYATNVNGTAYGEIKTFTTNSSNASVTTSDASSVTASSAIVGGVITDNGGQEIVSYGILYGTASSDLGQTLEKSENISGSYTITLEQLLPATTYYYKAFANNSLGTSYGETKSFTTETSKPVVDAEDAANITSVSATINANIISNGGSETTEYGFIWGTSESSLSVEVKFSGAKIGNYYSNLSALSANTTYYYKAFATNQEGRTESNLKSFTTKKSEDGGTGDDFNYNNW